MNKPKEEVEMEKKRLMDIKRVTAETVEKIRKMEVDYSEEKTQYQKKLTNLSSIKASQNVREGKLSNDLKSMETILISQKEDLKALRQKNAEMVMELQNVKATNATTEEAFIKQFDELKMSVKQGHLRLKHDKDNQIILEVMETTLKNEEQKPILVNLIRRKREAQFNRLRDIDEERAEIDKEKSKVESELKKKKEDLIQLKQKYIELKDVYNTGKN